MEEEYGEQQFFVNYHRTVNRLLMGRLTFDADGGNFALAGPGPLPPAHQKEFSLILRSIQQNRQFILNYYGQLETQIWEVMDML